MIGTWLFPVALYVVLPLLGSGVPAPPGNPPASVHPANVLSSGEELVYEVRWSFFSIGTIRLRTSSPVLMYGTPHRRVDAFVDSHDGLPLVDFHAVISSFLDSTFISHGSRAFRRRDDHWRGWEYTIDTAARAFYIDELTVSGPFAEPSQRTRHDTVRVKDVWRLQDGISILCFARAIARLHVEETIPVISQGKLGSAWFSCGKEATMVEIDAHPRPIRTIPFEGLLTAKGMYGLTGDFKGWVSDDEAAVPIRAELQVLLGKIKVELKEWKRTGWIPPQ
jgi:hypothetical protein